MMTIDRTSYSVSMIGVYKKVSTLADLFAFSVFSQREFGRRFLCRCHLDVPHDARSSDGSLLRSDCQRREL
jgi:hypothetical protein